MEKNSSSNGAQSLERVLNILEMIKEDGSMEVNILSQRMNMHRSSIYRILSVLQKRGYVRQNPDTSQFSLGFKFLEMAEGIDIYKVLNRAALPFLEELMHLTRETCHLTALDQGEVVFLAKVESMETIRMHSRVGIRMPSYSTSGGKVLLANLSKSMQESILNGIELKKLTPNTITNRKELAQSLQEVVLQGYAIDNEENEDGIMCVAAPISKAGGEVIAAVSLSCPTFRTSMEKLQSYTPVVKEAAYKISLALRD